MYSPSSANTGTPAENHIANYWRKQVSDRLERLESEARRMLTLEAELSHFASEYYNAVGEVTERLAGVEERLANSESAVHYASPLSAPPISDILAGREAAEERKQELKIRYRQLAKEIHPDRVSLATGSGASAGQMQTLNAAYRQGDLAAMLKLEAEMLLADLVASDFADTTSVEQALREIERATRTYAESYRTMLHSPLNELMLRAMSARLAGWDWMQAVVQKIERTIEEKERAMIEAGIAQISQWRTDVQEVA